MTESEARYELAGRALSYVGTEEGSSLHHWLVDQYNKIKPLPRGYAVKYSDPWCALFVSVMAKLSGMLDIIPAECGCGEMVRAFQKMKCWEERDDHRPEIGDICFYDWQDTGSGDCTGEPDHVGIVTKVYDNTFVVTEGNYKDRVGNREVVMNGVNIRGFGIPDYAGWAARLGDESGVAIWALEARKWAMDAGITDGKRPTEKVTRQEEWTMLYRLYNKYIKE